MQFKNAVVYNLPMKFVQQLNLSELQESLQEHPAELPDKRTFVKLGWESPYFNSPEMVAVSQNLWLMKLCINERVLPSAAINREVSDRCKALSIDGQRTIGRKERDEIKDDVIATRLPDAPIKRSYMYGYFDRLNCRLVIDSSTWNKAEVFTSFLRDCLLHLPIVPITCMTHSVSSELTNTLTGANVLSGSIQRGQYAKLTDGNTKVTYQGYDLGSYEEEITEQIMDNGLTCSALQLTKFVEDYDLLGDESMEEFSFVVTDQLELRKMSANAVDSYDAGEDPDVNAVLQADLLLTNDIVNRCLEVVKDVVGAFEKIEEE